MKQSGNLDNSIIRVGPIIGGVGGGILGSYIGERICSGGESTCDSTPKAVPIPMATPRSIPLAPPMPPFNKDECELEFSKCKDWAFSTPYSDEVMKQLDACYDAMAECEKGGIPSWPHPPHTIIH